MNIILLLLAIIPGLYLLYYVYKLDRIEKEPISLLLILFVLGCLTIIPAIIFERISLGTLESVLGSTNIVYIFFECLFVGFIEEAVKYLALYLGSWKNKNFNYVFDGIVYAVCVSLGFAIVENIMYGASYGLSTILVRAITAIPFHAIFSIFMGEYYGLAKWNRSMGNTKASKKCLGYALLVPALVHAAYDFAASIPIAYYVFYLMVFKFEYSCFRRVKEYAVMDKPI